MHPILVERAAQAAPVLRLREVGRLDARRIVAHEVLVLEVPPRGAVEYVRPRLGHGVDQAAREASLPDVERGDEHLVLPRSEEHTSELQSRLHLVCRLLLEKKKQLRTNESRSMKFVPI